MQSHRTDSDALAVQSIICHVYDIPDLAVCWLLPTGIDDNVRAHYAKPEDAMQLSH